MPTRALRCGIVALAACGVVTIAGLSVAQPERSQPPAGRQPPQEGGPRRSGAGGQSIEQCMKAINRAFRALRGQIEDGSKKDENLDHIWTMQRNVVQAKSLPMEKVPDAQREALTTDFRKGQIELMRMLLSLEVQVMEGKTEEAARTLAAIHELEEREHKKFGVRD